MCSYETIKQFFCLPYVLLFRPPASRFLLLLVTSMTYRLSSSSIVQHYSSGRVGVSERERDRPLPKTTSLRFGATFPTTSHPHKKPSMTKHAMSVLFLLFFASNCTLAGLILSLSLFFP